MPTPPPPTALRVLGIDPGTHIVGFGVVEVDGPRFRAVAHGALRAPKGASIAIRLASLAGDLREVVAKYAPVEAALEEAFHGRDARAALAIGEARGAFTVVVADAGLPLRNYANNVVKKAVTGAGRASKEQVQAAVRRILGLAELPTPFDAADALAVAVCHLQRRSAPGAGTRGRLSPRIAKALRKQGLDPRRLRRP